MNRRAGLPDVVVSPHNVDIPFVLVHRRELRKLTTHGEQGVNITSFQPCVKGKR